MSAWHSKVAAAVIFAATVLLFQNCSHNSADEEALINKAESSLSTACASSELSVNGVCQSAVSYRLSPEQAGTLQQTINNAIQTGQPAIIQLSSGIYRLTCENSAGSYCLNIAGAKGLSIQGVPGETQLLINGPRAGAVVIQKSNDVSISGVTIDYTIPPFSQGHVLSLTDRTVDIEVDSGFPDLKDTRLFDLCVTDQACAISGEVFTADGQLSRADYIPQYVSVNGPPQSLGGAKWRVVSFIDTSTNTRSRLVLTDFVHIGDRIAFGQRQTPVIFGLISNNISLRQVQIYSGPGMGLVFMNIDGAIDLRNIQIKPTPGSNHVLSVNADALHVWNSTAQVTLRDSYFTNMGDDALNIKVGEMKVSAVSGQQVSFNIPADAAQSRMLWRAGDEVQFMDPTRKLLRVQATIAGVSQGTNSMVVTFANTVGSVQPGDSAFNTNFASPNSVIANNYFGSFRGGLRLRSPKATFYKNVFMDGRMANILFSVDSYWPEGPLAGPPYMAGNRVVNGTLRLFNLDWAPYQGLLFPPPVLPE